MSYDVAICVPPLPPDDGEAWERLETAASENGSVFAVLSVFAERLTDRYPCSSQLPDDRADDCVWNAPLLPVVTAYRILYLNIAYSKVDEVLPFVIETANDLGLTVFDLQTRLIHRGDGFPGLRLEVEDQKPIPRPSVQHIADVVGRMTPDGGPGFVILEGRGKDYAQAAGGAGQFTVEWREYGADGFSHYVAGVPGGTATREVKIRTNGSPILVLENERLAAADVVAILTAYGRNAGRPSTYQWRDITARFV